MYRKLENDELEMMSDKLIYTHFQEKFIIYHSSFIFSKLPRNLR